MEQRTPITIEHVPIDAVHEHPKNARDGSATEAMVKESLTTHGQYVPILVQRSTGHVLKGNHTHRYMAELGFTTVAVVYHDVDDDEATRIMLVDNPAGESATYRADALVELLESLGGDYVGSGYTETDLDALRLSLEPAAVGPYDRPSTGGVLALQDVGLGEPTHEVHRGQVWQMGPVTHRHTDDGSEQTSGPHFLCLVKVATGWPVFVPLLTDGRVLLPYPGPYLAVTKLGLSRGCVFVQPDGYLAGHLLDKWAAVFPGSVTRREDLEHVSRETS